MFKIVLPGKVVPKGRPRFTKVGHVYTPQTTRDYESLLKAAAIEVMNGRRPIAKPVAVTVQAYLQIPKSWPKKKRETAYYVDTKPDVDNFKFIDALNGVVWTDDKLATDLFINKRYNPNPRLEIIVQEMPDMTGVIMWEGI